MVSLGGLQPHQIAGAIARAINVTLTMPEQARLSIVRSMNRDAYEAFLKGRYRWNKRTVEGIAKSIECYQRALTIDPRNAIVYASLATSYSQSQSAPTERFPRAREAALRAMELDDNLAESEGMVREMVLDQRGRAIRARPEGRALMSVVTST